MPKKAKPPDLNRKWEKNRRDRLKEKFMLLAKALPCYDPSVTLCHEFILENARITIEEQQKEIDKILTERSNNVQDLKDEKIKKLQNKIKKLLFRNEQLSFILKDVGIPLPTYVGSGRFRKSQIKSDTGSEEHFLKKLNKEKENIVTKLVQRKKKGKTAPKKPSGKNLVNKNCINAKISTTPSSSCLLMLSQPTAVKSSIPQPCYLLTNGVPDKLAASKSTIPETKTISCLNVNTPLSAFGSGTLLFANGTIMPVLSQPQIIIPTPNPVVAVQKTFPTFATLPKIITNVTLSQPHVTLQSTVVSTAAAPFVPPSKTVLLTPVTSCVTMNSVQKKISENLKKFPKVVPKRCLTTTTQVNKVPIPALTSKYANNYILLTESNVVKAQITPKNSEKDKKSSRGGKRKNEEQPKLTVKKGKLENTGVGVNTTKSDDMANEPNKVLEPQNENDCPKKNSIGEDITDSIPVDKPEITITQQLLPESTKTPEENTIEPTTSESFVEDITSTKEKSSNEIIKESENTIKATTPPATTASSSTVVNSNEEMKTLDHLVHSELSNDIFASLQVPPGCQNPDSTSPTAAFLLAFPLVSSVKVSEVMEEENLESQSSTPTLLQIGAIDGVKTTQSDNLLNLDNFTLFSSKNVYGEYYGSFGLGHNEGGKNIENLHSKEESMKPSEIGSKTNETAVDEKNNLGDESSNNIEHSKNKNALENDANIKHPEPNEKNCSNVYQQNKSANVWPSDEYKNQNINFDIQCSKHQNVAQQNFLDGKNVKNAISNNQPIHKVNTDENNSTTCNKNQNLLRVSGVSCDSKDTKTNQISLNNTQQPVIPQSHSTTPESWAPKNPQVVTVSYEMPSLNMEKQNETLTKNVDHEILNKCRNNELNISKKPEDSISHWNPDSTKNIIENSKTCFDVCSTHHNVDRNSKTDDQRNKICDVWDVKEQSTETREASKELLNNMSNTSNINLQYNIQLNNSSTTGKVTIGQHASESTEKHNLNPIRQNKVNISENIFNAQDSDGQKQLWSIKSTENVKKSTTYQMVENDLTNMWNTSQRKTNCYKEDNANLLHCDTKNSVASTKEPVKPVQNPGKINSVWSPNNYEDNISTHKPISNIPTKNQPSYGNVSNQASHNINNRNQPLVNMAQKDQHQKHDHQQNHHTHQQQQTPHQLQQKQHIHPLVHCNNFNMYQDPLISDNKLPQHSNANLKPTTNFWSSSDLSYDKQNSTQYNTFNSSKSNQYDSTRYIPHELPKSNNIDKYQNHSWNQDVMGNYQYVSGSSIQETGPSNNNQNNSTNHIQQSSDKDVLNQNQKQNANIWQTNFAQGVVSYNLHQGSSNKITQNLINANDKPNVSSLWVHNQNQDVLNSYDMQPGVNIQYQPQEILGRPSIENNKNPNVNAINYGMHQRSNNEQKHLWSVDSASFNNHYNLEFEKPKDQQNLTAKNEKKNGNGWNGYSKKVNQNVNENLKHTTDFSQSSSKTTDNNSYGVYQDKNSVSVSASETFVNNCIKTKGGIEKQADHDNFTVFMGPTKEVLQNANNNHDKTNSTTNKASDNSHYHSKDNTINRSNKSNNNSNIKIIEQSQSKQIGSGEVGEQNHKNLEKNQCYFSTTYPSATCNFNYKPNYSRNYTNPVYTSSNCTYNYSDPTFNQSYYKPPVVKNDAKYYGLNYENYQDTTKYYPNSFQVDRRNTNINKNAKTVNAHSKPINWMTTPETKLQSTDCYLPTFSSQSYSFTSCVTTEPSEISEPKKAVEFSSNEDKQFSWSPTKFPNFLDPSHNFVTTTLPTLAGDLALTTLNDQKTDYKYPKEQRRTSGNCGDNQSVNFLSVSQLVDHTKSENTPSRTTTRRNSGSRSKGTVSKRNKSPKQDTTTDKGSNQNKINNFGQNDIFYEHKARNPIKNVSNNYSAEALIGNQDSEANSKKCEIPVNKSFGSSSFLTENIITYFPTVEENYGVSSQNLQNVPSFTHNNFQNTTYSTSSFIYTASTIASSYLPNNFDTNIHEFSSENVNSDQSATKDKVCNKSYRQGSTKEEKQNGCVNNSKKVRKKQSEVNNPTNFSSFEYPFLTVPGSTNSPILPEDFHMHTSFLPPTATPYPCKTSLYQKQTNDFNPNTLLPLPGLPRTGVQHPEVSPSINSAGTSFTNFNLSTIFPEINKGTTTNVYQDSNIKETSNAGPLQVPFSAEPKYTFNS